jgi:hypothetical protein
MRILVEDYSNVYTTEPIYFCNAAKIAGCESHLWNTNIHSAYDILDMFKPNVLVLKWNCQRLHDVINYYKENPKTFDLVLNVTGAEESVIKTLKMTGLFKHVFTNDYNGVSADVQKTHLLMPGADIFLPPSTVPCFMLEAGICSETLEKTYDFESYHKLGFGFEEKENADVTVNLGNLISIYGKYKQFILYGDIRFLFSQIFFDATLRANRLTLKNKKEDDEEVKIILGKIFSFDSEENVEQQIKTQILKKNTCFNRTQQLLAMVGNIESARNLNQQIERL